MRFPASQFQTPASVAKTGDTCITGKTGIDTAAKVCFQAQSQNDCSELMIRKRTPMFGNDDGEVAFMRPRRGTAEAETDCSRPRQGSQKTMSNLH